MTHSAYTPGSVSQQCQLSFRAHPQRLCPAQEPNFGTLARVVTQRNTLTHTCALQEHGPSHCQSALEPKIRFTRIYHAPKIHTYINEYILSLVHTWKKEYMSVSMYFLYVSLSTNVNLQKSMTDCRSDSFCCASSWSESELCVHWSQLYSRRDTKKSRSSVWNAALSAHHTGWSRLTYDSVLLEERASSQIWMDHVTYLNEAESKRPLCLHTTGINTDYSTWKNG
jgi:hypothetical protein